MKKSIFLLLLFMLSWDTSVSQDTIIPQMDSLKRTEPTNEMILKELEIIRSIQVESKQKTDSIRNARKHHEAQAAEKSENDMSNEYDAMTQIADNTRQDRIKDNWNLYGWVAFAIALLTLWAQIRTDKNTSKLSREEQKALLSDMIRHLYRNYVVSLTLRVKLESGKRGKTEDDENKNYTGYPSEEHLKKMMVNLQDIHLNLFYKENEFHQLMNKLYVMLRNYNIEIDVICDHLKSPTIDYATKSRDLETLAFKCYNLTKEITKLIGCIWYNNEKSYIPQARERIIKEQEKNRKDNSDESRYYTGQVEINVPDNSYYLETLFSSEKEDFLNNLKKDIQIEAGLNTSSSPKIHIIKFQN